MQAVDREERDATSAAVQVAEVLRTDVTEGRLGPGARIKDLELATRCGVSRQTAREALHLMSAEGLVTLRLHSGATVRRLDLDDVVDIYRVRRTVECSAIRGSARAPDHLYAGVEHAVLLAESLALGEDWAGAATASLRVHEAIVALLESRSMTQFFAQQIAQLRVGFWNTPIGTAIQARWIARDREIVDLLSGGQRESAALTMSQYLDDSEEAVLDTFRAWERRATAR